PSDKAKKLLVARAAVNMTLDIERIRQKYDDKINLHFFPLPEIVPNLNAVSLIAAHPSMRTISIAPAAILFLFALSASPVCAAETNSATDFNGSTPLQWSERMADSQITRLDGRLAWKPSGGGKWDYTAGLFTLSLLKLNEQIPNPSHVAFATNAIGSFISVDGNLADYHPDEYQLDAINPGKTVLALYFVTKEVRYAKAAALLFKQFATQPRTPEGGFWHKERYTNQMWLDGLYMGDPFYAEYTKMFGGPTTNFDDVAHQFALVKEHLYDAKTG